ncbi:hypothetical protein ACFO3I_03290 [Rheinheimera marina]|uniref:Uncharacterized protein n=1 Tax=Rheinheimera marina TaxID=1774958 RepID=A0ABV9JHA0_9GAMM
MKDGFITRSIASGAAVLGCNAYATSPSAQHHMLASIQYLDDGAGKVGVYGAFGRSGCSMPVRFAGLLGLAWWRRRADTKPGSRFGGRLVAAVALALGLSACGGGGGESSTPTTPPVVTKPDLKLTVAGTANVLENTTLEVPVTISGAQGGVTASVTRTGPDAFAVTSTLGTTGGKLQLQLGDLFADSEGTVTVSITDGDGRTSNATLAVTLKNSPGFHRVVASLPEQGTVLKEGESLTIQLQFDGASGAVQVVATPQSKEDTITTISELSATGGMVTVNAGELQYHDQPFKLTLAFTDAAGQTLNKTYAISLVNPSGAEAIQALTRMMAAAPAFSELGTERELVRRLAMLAVLSNPSYAQPESTLLTQFDNTLAAQGQQAVLTEWLAAHTEDASRYSSGVLKENSVKEATTSLLTLLRSHAAVVNPVIAEAVAVTNGLVPALTLDAVTYDATSNKLSRFIGNSAFGQYQNDQWQFGSNYAFLTSIVFPETQQCSPE